MTIGDCWEYCEHCRRETPHQFIYRVVLTWVFRCRVCGIRKTIKPHGIG